MLCYLSDMQSEPFDQRVPVMMTSSGARAVDDWRRAQQDLPSRSEAIRRLIELGLKASGESEKP
jgi:hypothetical protein